MLQHVCDRAAISWQVGFYRVEFFVPHCQVLNLEFSFFYNEYTTKSREPSLPYNLPIASWGRRDRFMSFPKALT